MLKYFHAGFEGFEKLHPPLLDVLPHRLIAFDQVRNGKFDQLYYRDHRDQFKKLILDSGAYWAWRHNSEVNRADYTRYCQEHADDIDIFVSLDRIPGRFLTKKEREVCPRPPASEYKISAEVSYENYLHMVDAMARRGVSQDRIIYVFHQGEPLDFLAARVEDDKLPYIGLSQSDPFSATVPQKREWLDKCMAIIRNKDGSLKNNVKLHAFGLWTPSLIADFPWYSIDNSTWGGGAKIHFIYMPKLKNPDSTGSVRIDDERWEEKLNAKWDFSTVDKIDMAFVRERSSYFMKKKLPKDYQKNPEKLRFRREQLNYIMTIFHYCYDMDLDVGNVRLHRQGADKHQSELLPNEFFLSKDLSDMREENQHGTVDSEVQWTVVQSVKGILVSRYDRMWLNAKTLNLFAGHPHPGQRLLIDGDH